jgi:hypothetical protein
MSISRLMQMAAAGAGGDYQISRSLTLRIVRI